MGTLIYLGVTLPTTHDSAICIYTLASISGTAKRYTYFSLK